MTTLATLTLKAAEIVTDVYRGTATAGSTSSLTDATRLTQQNQWFDRGTLWLLSGDNAGDAQIVQSHAAGVLTIPTLAAAIGAGDLYAVARASYPWHQLVAAVHGALSETFVVSEAVSDPPADILGDGTTIAFDIPTGYSHVVKVVLEDPGEEENTFPSSHWHEEDGSVIFDYGYAPLDDWVIHIYCRADHPTLSDPSSDIDPQINEEWLRWKTAEYLLYWAVGVYGTAPEYRIEERLNRVLAKSKGLYPRKPLVIFHSAGSGGYY